VLEPVLEPLRVDVSRPLADVDEPLPEAPDTPEVEPEALPPEALPEAPPAMRAFASMYEPPAPPADADDDVDAPPAPVAPLDDCTQPMTRTCPGWLSPDVLACVPDVVRPDWLPDAGRSESVCGVDD